MEAVETDHLSELLYFLFSDRIEKFKEIAVCGLSLLLGLVIPVLRPLRQDTAGRGFWRCFASCAADSGKALRWAADSWGNFGQISGHVAEFSADRVPKEL